jgi:hypothetical protein
VEEDDVVEEEEMEKAEEEEEEEDDNEDNGKELQTNGQGEMVNASADNVDTMLDAEPIVPPE